MPKETAAGAGRTPAATSTVKPQHRAHELQRCRQGPAGLGHCPPEGAATVHHATMRPALLPTLCVSSVNMKVRYTIPWNAEYAKSNSTEAEAKKQALKNNLEPPMKLKIPLMKELVINSLTQGSVVADYDVILNSDVEGGNVEAR
ncbi:hypothetical protein FJT64_020180 [Amphibalanus amphitrite]|uniref:Uncharacterized protein n=1 Tax=Amphibalanus amphitrite TaxID=1232801 RepID=A0A6A4WY82_AMPAM|nr:hypothetical protein FJT64_020180 [Amphibalanus amphitrite]